MANPPFSSVREILDVEIPRPRDRASVADQPAWHDVQRRLLGILAEDSIVAA
jgi:hypothetical protein